MDKFKLQWKVFAYLIGFCAALVVLLWLMQTVFLNEMYQFVRKTEIRKAITLVEKNIDSPNLQKILYDLQVEKDIMVAPTPDFMPPAAPDGRGREQMKTITQEKTFTLADGQKISITFHALISPVDATVSTLRLQLLLVTAIMVLLSVGLALAMARRIAKPIESINENAKTLAAGNYEARFDGRGFQEIKELSDTLNTAAAELSKVEGLRRELMANVSHDLRTPLALIFSYAEMMHDFPDEITAEQTQVIMDETKRLTSLVNDVLDLSAFEEGERKPITRQYCLTESLQRTIDRVSELVKKDGYALSFESEEDIVLVADEGKITQAFYNLLLNAIIHGGKDKTVIVRQTAGQGFAKIEVEDHGDGIEAESLPYVWERYYKVDKTHKRPVTGTGLGLSIVKKIVEMHGGQYGVSSTPGAGSIFWFQLSLS